MNRYEKAFNPCGLWVPESIPKSKAFSAAKSFEAPKELILTGYCTPVEDQGSKPWCAAYAAANFAENVLWRKNGFREQIDPAPLYAHAKTIDGNPTGDGTYLECTLKALLHEARFDASVCKVRTFGGSFFGRNAINDARYAIHRYGVCMAGFDITNEWFSPKQGVIRGGGDGVGGHAVLIVGYDDGGFVIQNSWGEKYAHGGFVYVTNSAFNDQFIYGALLTNVFDGLK